MAEQLSLFGEENTTYNTAMGHLLDLRFASAITVFTDYARFFPWGRAVDREIAMADFWMDRAGTGIWEPCGSGDPEGVYRLWLDFERAFGFPRDRDGIEAGLQAAIFSRLAEAMIREGADRRHTLPQGTPVGLIFLRAGHVEEAISRFQALVWAEPENSLAYGYLGDAHTLRSDVEAAMACYSRSLALDPEQLDRDHLLCTDLARELRDFESREGEGGRGPAWFPAVARLEGVFRPIPMNDLDELRFWHSRFRTLRDNSGTPHQATLAPMVFVHAMVLSDNAALARHVPDFDLIEIRKTMKEIDEDLFLRHMEQIRKEEAGGPGHAGSTPRLRRA